MVIFGHHTDGFFQVAIGGRAFPDGMAEHALAAASAVVVAALAVYGAWAALRDARRWLRGRRATSLPQTR